MHLYISIYFIEIAYRTTSRSAPRPSRSRRKCCSARVPGGRRRQRGIPHQRLSRRAGPAPSLGRMHREQLLVGGCHDEHVQRRVPAECDREQLLVGAVGRDLSLSAKAAKSQSSTIKNTSSTNSSSSPQFSASAEPPTTMDTA